MPGGRLLLPSVALVVAASAGAVERRRWVALPVVAWALWVAIGVRPRELHYDRMNTVLPGGGGEDMGRYASGVLPAGSWMLTRDAGVVAYFAGPEVNVIDIHPFSLTEPRLTGKTFDLDFLLGRDPAALVTTVMTEEEWPTSYPEERRLLRDARVKARFRPVRDAVQHHRRHYRLWLREDVGP